jgi:hypothetical protein
MGDLTDFDGKLYVNARGWKLLYNALVVVWLWVTRWRRDGHWYFDG